MFHDSDISVRGMLVSNTDFRTKEVQTQDDANKVLIIIVDQAKEAAPGYTSITWGDTTVNGAIAGSAVVIGSYQEVWSGSGPP